MQQYYWEENKLRYYRKLKNYTQKQLVDCINVIQQAVQRWENGTKEPTLQNLIDLY